MLAACVVGLCDETVRLCCEFSVASCRASFLRTARWASTCRERASERVDSDDDIRDREARSGAILKLLVQPLMSWWLLVGCLRRRLRVCLPLRDSRRGA